MSIVHVFRVVTESVGSSMQLKGWSRLRPNHDIPDTMVRNQGAGIRRSKLEQAGNQWLILVTARERSSNFS